MAAVAESDDNAAAITTSGRSTRVVVDLDVIAANVRYFRSVISPAARVMAVVKADGYGHGAVAVAREAVRSGAAHLAVATVGEGVELRVAGLAAPILVLGPIDPSEVGLAVEHGLALAVADRRFVELVRRVADGIGARRVPLHLKVDTGMRRFGVLPADAVEVAQAATAAGHLGLAGVFTHFADADAGEETSTQAQAAIFEGVIGRLADVGIRPLLIHAANSATALRWRRYDYDMVRIGIALYGLPPGPGFPLPEAVSPALRVDSKVARLIPLDRGDGVGYGFSYRARGVEVAALVPIGYADGYPRGLSNRGWMAVRGRRMPVLGRVSMDQTVIRIDGTDGVAVGEPVAVLGGQGPSLDEVASRLGTISYEIATGLARRMPRTYVRGMHDSAAG